MSPTNVKAPTTLALRQNDQTLMYVLKKTQPSYSKGVLDACRVMASIVGIAAVLKMIWSGSKYETRFKSLKQMLSACKRETRYVTLPQQQTVQSVQLQQQPPPIVKKTYATTTATSSSKKRKRGGRAKANKTMSQTRQPFKWTFSRKHRNKGRISKGTSKSKTGSKAKTITGRRSIKHTVSSRDKHELADVLKEIHANESKQALNACLMLVPVFGMAAVIGMLAGSG